MAAGVAQGLSGGSSTYAATPFTNYQGHFLVPVRPELTQLPFSQIRGQLMKFIHLGPVNFDTMVFHTGSGELNKLGFYFNEHIMSIIVLNAMFNNGSNGDRAQFDQAPGLRLFNMQESQKVGTLGNRNQALHPTGDQVCRQGALDQEHQAWQMEMAHAHLRTLDWVLQQEPYPGSDAQSSIDREEEMSRVRQVEMEMDVDMESEEEVSCAFAIKDNKVPARSLESKNGKVATQPPLSPRRTRSGVVLSPKSQDEPMSEGGSEEAAPISPRRTRNGAFF